MAAATAARRYALNLVRDIPPAAAPDADTAALLDRGCQTLQTSLAALQPAVGCPQGGTYTRSASLFDLIEQRLAAPGSNAGSGYLALRDLRLIDGALAELAEALGVDITSYDTGPASNPVPSAGRPAQPSLLQVRRLRASPAEGAYASASLLLAPGLNCPRS